MGTSLRRSAGPPRPPAGGHRAPRVPCGHDGPPCVPQWASRPAGGRVTRMTYAEAAREAIARAMREDPRVWCVGEDLGRGGVFQQYKGLAEEFGPERISDAPISEAAIMGAAFGAAMVGTRPVVEMRFADFALCATDELVNQVAKARFMFGGQSRAPMVIRMPQGMWRSSAAQHSQSLEALYAHVPGLVVVCPSTPQDNFSLMRLAIASDDPGGLPGAQGPVGLRRARWTLDAKAAFGRARVRCEGRDVTAGELVAPRRTWRSERRTGSPAAGCRRR